MLRLGDPGIVSHPVLLVEIPDPFDELPVEPLGAALGHIRPDLAVIAKDPLAHAPQAFPSAKIQIDDGIAFLEPCFHGPAVVAVNDPPVHLKRHVQPCVEFLPADVLPAGAPPQLVQMDHRKAQFLLQRPGKRGFPRPGAANN